MTTVEPCFQEDLEWWWYIQELTTVVPELAFLEHVLISACFWTRSLPPNGLVMLFWLCHCLGQVLPKDFCTNVLFGSLLNKAHGPILRMFSNRLNKICRITKECNYTEIHFLKYLKNIFMVSSIYTFLLKH